MSSRFVAARPDGGGRRVACGQGSSATPRLCVWAGPFHNPSGVCAGRFHHAAAACAGRALCVASGEEGRFSGRDAA
eukprot:692764-Prymnesium_polylepis.1